MSELEFSSDDSQDSSDPLHSCKFYMKGLKDIEEIINTLKNVLREKLKHCEKILRMIQQQRLQHYQVCNTSHIEDMILDEP